MLLTVYCLADLRRYPRISPGALHSIRRSEPVLLTGVIPCLHGRTGELVEATRVKGEGATHEKN